MKIAFLFYNLTTRGGSPRVFLSLAKQLSQMGHDVVSYVFYYDRENTYGEIANDTTIVANKHSSELFNNSETLLPRIKAGIDYLAMPAWGSGIRGKYDILCAHEALCYLAALHAKRNIRCPAVWYVADPAQYVFRQQSGILYNKNVLYKTASDIFATIDRRFVQKLDAVYVPSKMMEKMVSDGYGIHARSLPIGGVDTEQFDSSKFSPELLTSVRARLGIPEDGFLLLSMGFYFPHRRLEDCLTALRILLNERSDLYYVIAGDPSNSPIYSSYIFDLVNKMDLKDHVKLVKRELSELEVLEFYATCDIFLFANETQTWGLSPLEALAMSKPVILTSGAGVHEVLTHGINAMIVPPRSPHSIAENIRLLLSDTALRRSIERTGRKFVEEHFSYGECTRRMLDAFQIVINRCT